MKKQRKLLTWLAVLFVSMLVVAGCMTSSMAITPVIEGQKAPHAGYNIGPELWVEPGAEVKVTGAVIWIAGTEPNNLFAE